MIADIISPVIEAVEAYKRYKEDKDYLDLVSPYREKFVSLMEKFYSCKISHKISEFGDFLTAGIETWGITTISKFTLICREMGLFFASQDPLGEKKLIVSLGGIGSCFKEQDLVNIKHNVKRAVYDPYFVRLDYHEILGDF